MVSFVGLACSGSATSWTERGDELLLDNDLLGAEAAYNRAIDLDAHYAPALYGKGWTLYASGFETLRPVARQLFQRAIEYQPEFFGGYRGKGVLLLDSGQVMAAETLLRSAFEKDPEEPGVLASLGQLYLQAGRLQEAEQLFVRALDLRPGRGELRRYLAEVELAREDLAAAMQQIEKGRDGRISGRRGGLVLDEGEERVLLETARLLLENPEGGDVLALEEASRALERAKSLLNNSGGPGMSRAPIEQRRRYHEVLARRLEERQKP
jgi:Tfp pilus assembly protein PilF